MKFRNDDVCLLNSPDLSPGLTQSVMLAFASCKVVLFSQRTARREKRRTRPDVKKGVLRTVIVENGVGVAGFVDGTVCEADFVRWSSCDRARARTLDMKQRNGDWETGKGFLAVEKSGSSTSFVYLRRGNLAPRPDDQSMEGTEGFRIAGEGR